MKDQVSQHLHSILEQAGEKPPYLMVGHSMGGVYIRAFYHLYPDEVVGMVFVDSAHENEMAFYPEPEGSTPDYFSTMMDFCEFIAGVGVLRATGVMGEIIEGSPGTALEQRQILSRLNRVSYCKGIRVEKEVSDIELSQTTPPASLGDLPLIVLVGAKQLNPIRNQFYIGPLPPAQRQNTQTWQEIQSPAGCPLHQQRDGAGPAERPLRALGRAPAGSRRHQQAARRVLPVTVELIQIEQ